MLAYYPNLVLIAAFLGLGLGCLRAGRRPLRWAWPVTLLVLVLTASALSRVVFTQNAPADHLFLLYYDLPPDSPVVADIRPPILILFVLAAASFVPLGQIVAERLRRFRERGRPLSGYRWDIAGSLVGIAGFTALSFARAFPTVWFAGVLALGLVFFRGRRRDFLVCGALAALVVLVVAASERAQQYSPYYAIATQARAAGAGSRSSPTARCTRWPCPCAGATPWPAAMRRSARGTTCPTPSPPAPSGGRSWWARARATT